MDGIQLGDVDDAARRSPAIGIDDADQFLKLSSSHKPILKQKSFTIVYTFYAEKAFRTEKQWSSLLNLKVT